MRIDAVMDFVCPWCFIGHARLRQALRARPQAGAEIIARPYLLDPAVPEGGYDLRSRLRQRYGTDPERMFARVEDAARATGLELDFRRIVRYPSTLRAHALVAHARGVGRQEETVNALFAAYFGRGEDIGDLNVLETLAREVGLDVADVEAALQDTEALASVREEADAMRRRGIDGVPFFALGGRAAIRGAEPIASMIAAIDRALA